MPLSSILINAHVGILVELTVSKELNFPSTKEDPRCCSTRGRGLLSARVFEAVREVTSGCKQCRSIPRGKQDYHPLNPSSTQLSDT